MESQITTYIGRHPDPVIKLCFVSPFILSGVKMYVAEHCVFSMAQGNYDIKEFFFNVVFLVLYYHVYTVSLFVKIIL